MKPELERSIATAIASLYDIETAIELSRPEERFGDYATNVALQLASRLGRAPREIAAELAQELGSNLSADIQSVDIAGLGFLNLRLTNQALAKAASAIPAQTLADQTIVTDYSDPNPFKPLHAGHLYTTLVGDAVSRLLEQAGAQVIRVNYGGDVGRHVAISMWAIVRKLGGELPEKLTDIPEAERAVWLGQCYVAGTQAFESDEAAKAKILANNRRVYQLQADDDHDSPFAQIYWTCRQWSYDYFETLYQQLQVRPFSRYIPESEVTPLGLSTVRAQQTAGVYTKSDGAVVYDGSADGLHTRVFINSEGLPTYETKDVGLLLTKWRDYHYDQSIIITANEQAQYFQVMFASVSRFEPEPVRRSRHISHGVVKLASGGKISSRKGNGPSALGILEAARQAAAALPNNTSEDTVLAAVKYAFAKVRIGGDIAYDPIESVALEGNSGPYLQYAHARARSILAKAAAGDGELTELEPAERSLLRKLSEYAETVDRATAELLPSHICSYLYELAQAFNRFYEHNRVIGDPRQAARLQLVQRYADTLKQGLELLGITALDSM